MKIVFLLFFLTITLFAKVVTQQEVTILKEDYPQANRLQLQEIALKKAKLAASKDIFGEYFSSETTIKNGEVIDDIIRERIHGVIHLQKSPEFHETSKSMSVNITAYASKKDIEDVSPHHIVLNDFHYSDPTISVKDLKKAAYNAFIFEAIQKKKPSVRDIEEAKYLALNVEILDEQFDIKTLNYTISGVVTYIPAFLNNYIPGSLHKSNQKTKKEENFYGTWQGFLRDWKHPLLQTDKHATDVTIEIPSFSTATIEYKALDCGGDLLVIEKTRTKVLFKESLTYGKKRCHANKTITLQRLTPRSLEIILENEDQAPFHGKVYLDEE